MSQENENENENQIQITRPPKPDQRLKSDSYFEYQRNKKISTEKKESETEDF